MSDIESRVRDIIVNELGVEPSKVTAAGGVSISMPEYGAFRTLNCVEPTSNIWSLAPADIWSRPCRKPDRCCAKSVELFWPESAKNELIGEGPVPSFLYSSFSNS